MCLSSRQLAIFACCSGEPIELYHNLQAPLTHHPAGEACKATCNDSGKKDSSQRAAGLKYSPPEPSVAQEGGGQALIFSQQRSCSSIEFKPIKETDEISTNKPHAITLPFQCYETHEGSNDGKALICQTYSLYLLCIIPTVRSSSKTSHSIKKCKQLNR